MKLFPKLAKGAYNDMELSKYKMALKSSTVKAANIATAEQPVPIYIHQAHQFAKDETNILLCWGKPDKTLKMDIKSKTKKEKKVTVAGKGFLRQEEDGSKTLCIYKSAGNAQPHKIFKAGKKLLMYVGIKAIEYLDPSGVELQEEDDDDVEDNATADVDTDNGQAAEQQLLALLGKYKNALPTIKKILPRLTKTDSVPAKFDGVINITKQIIERFSTAFEGATDEVKAKFQGAFDQMQRLGGVLNGKVSSDNQDVKSDIQQDEKLVRQLNELLNKLREKGKKLNVDGLYNRFVA